MQGYRVPVIGGYGFFGRRLVERLARQPKLLVVAGRSRAAAEACTGFGAHCGDRLEFGVRADVPLLGQVAQYHGHLVLPAEG